MNQAPASGVRLSFGGPMTATVKTLIIINVAIFVFMRLTAIPVGTIQSYLGLNPALLVGERAYWQLFTYSLIHDSGWLHLIFNMLALYWFGSDLERAWGAKSFLRFYLGAVLVAGLAVLFSNLSSTVTTIGSSGAIMALLTAFACMYPNRLMLFMLVIPIKAKYLVLIMIAMELLASASAITDNISHMAHLGGVGFALIWCYQRFGRFHLATWRRMLRRRRGKLKLVKSRKESPPTFH